MTYKLELRGCPKGRTRPTATGQLQGRKTRTSRMIGRKQVSKFMTRFFPRSRAPIWTDTRRVAAANHRTPLGAAKSLPPFRSGENQTGSDRFHSETLRQAGRVAQLGPQSPGGIPLSKVPTGTDACRRNTKSEGTTTPSACQRMINVGCGPMGQNPNVVRPESVRHQRKNPTFHYHRQPRTEAGPKDEGNKRSGCGTRTEQKQTSHIRQQWAAETAAC
uniref:Uncharacterized protein n=1 Tax=Trichuris muris TaxID=70415 RepID=A0A5S6QC22_TRIMR